MARRSFILLSILIVACAKLSFAGVCNELRPTTSVRMSCDIGRNPNSVCRFRCRGGYMLTNSRNRIRICRCTGDTCSWTGGEAICRRRSQSNNNNQRRPQGVTTTRRPVTRRPTTRPPIRRTTRRPTRRPTTRPTTRPTRRPTRRPTTRPTIRPTRRPTTTSRPTTTATTRPSCPSPQFHGHTYQVIDSWPTGAILRITINTGSNEIQNGWTVLFTFTRNLPRNFRFMSWTSRKIYSGSKYLAVGNLQHNRRLSSYEQFSFTVVLLGTSMRAMQGYTALVGFYTQVVADTSCFTLQSNTMALPPTTQNPTTTTTTRTRRTTTYRPTTRRTTTQRPQPRQTTRRTTRPTVRTTTRRTTTQQTTTISTTPSNIQIDESSVSRHSRGCNVLRNGLTIQNSGYEVVEQGVENSRRFRFNADVVIAGTQNRMNGWSLKLVFSKRITNIQVWEAVLSRSSDDGRVFIFQPHSWNEELRDDFSFLIIPEMSSEGLPQVVMFLCPREVTPNLNWDGIFRDRSTTSSNEAVSPEERDRLRSRQEQLRQRQEEIAREQRRQVEERRRQQELERQQREEGQSTQVTTTTQLQTQRTQPATTQTTRRPPTRRPTTRRPTTRRPTTRRPTRRPNTSSSRRCSNPMGIPPSNPGQTRVRFRRSPPRERRPYDYNEVISMSILFYEAQRSGELPSSNRIPWRGDSGLRDGCDVGVDLTGGWYDAGDHVKFGFPLAWSVTTLAWGVIEFKDAYVDANEYRRVLDSLKWVADYFVKAHTSRYELYGQVGSGRADHLYWGRSEDLRMNRPSYKIDASNPGTELAAETAAALAACSVVFKNARPGYSRMLLRHATELYEFADRYRRSYHLSIPDVTSYYRSYSGYNDELVWGALWLYRATGMRSYLEDAKRKYEQYGQGNTPIMFSWDDKRAGSQVLLANFTGEAKYKGHVANYQRFLNGALKTPRGLVWLDQWGSNRYAANAAFIALAAAKVPGIANRNEMITFAETQIHYMLGGGGRSYVVGYGQNPPTQPHHRGSSCPAAPSECSWGNFHSSAANHFTLYGALVAGPGRDDSYTDNRGDYIANEVAVDYNAGFQSAVAGLKYFKIKQRR
ncbi:uncharacterized protein LOC100175432 [Ciona intestinalis]